MPHTASAPPGSTAAPLGLPARFIGIITAPRETYARVAAHPAWFGMFLLTAAIAAFGAALPMTTEAGKQAAVDQQVAQLEAFGMQVSDRQYEQIQQGTGMLPYTTAGGVFIGSLFMSLVLAGVLFAIFNAGMGGDARYKQILAVLVHAGVISSLGQLFTAPINYARGAVGSATNLTAFLPMIDETSFAGRLASMIDVFVIWWVVVLAIGLGVLYRRRTQPIATTLFAIYAVIALAYAAITS